LGRKDTKVKGEKGVQLTSGRTEGFVVGGEATIPRGGGI